MRQASGLGRLDPNICPLVFNALCGVSGHVLSPTGLHFHIEAEFDFWDVSRATSAPRKYTGYKYMAILHVWDFFFKIPRHENLLWEDSR